MPLDADFIRAFAFPEIETRITDRDVMFYALSIGLGRDPMDAHDLRYVYEQGLKVFPTMPIVIGHPGNWMVTPGTGITRTMVVHGAQRIRSFRDLPIGGSVISVNRIVDVWDKGDKGAVIDSVRETFDKATGDLVARSESSAFCRADGGFGGASGPGYEFRAVPDRAPDRVIDVPTEANLALLYRLNNDRNPLHADPAAASKAGFARPILHGLATFGVAAGAIAQAVPERTIEAFESRFSKPVFPGETVTLDIWGDGDGALVFRARVKAREVVVLDRGRVTWLTE